MEPQICSTGAPAGNAEAWEAAYLRFETPEQEIRKFQNRLRRLGASSWNKNVSIVELFCGRGNGLHALDGLGFTNLEGVDLSPALIRQYKGHAKCYTSDCRCLPFADHSKDILIVQGGLHHLVSMPADLERTFVEMRRVLKTDGLVVFVEPWLTPFLKAVHSVCANRAARRVSAKLDALATMIEYERETYEQWLNQPKPILRLASEHFRVLRQSFGWGKWNFVGSPKPI